MAEASKRKSVLQLVSQFEDISEQQKAIPTKKPSFVSYISVQLPTKPKIAPKRHLSVNKKVSTTVVTQPETKPESLNEIIDNIQEIGDKLIEQIDNSIEDYKIVNVNIKSGTSEKVIPVDKREKSVKNDKNDKSDYEERFAKREEKRKLLVETMILRNPERNKDSPSICQDNNEIPKIENNADRDQCQYDNPHYENYTLPNQVNSSMNNNGDRPEIESIKSDKASRSSGDGSSIRSSNSSQFKHHHYENYTLPSVSTSNHKNENEMSSLDCDSNLYTTIPVQNDDKIHTNSPLSITKSNRMSSSSQSSSAVSYENPFYQYVDLIQLRGTSKETESSCEWVGSTSSCNEETNCNSDYVTITTYVKLPLNYASVEKEDTNIHKDLKEYIVDELINTEEYYIDKQHLAIKVYQESLKPIIGQVSTEAIFNVFGDIYTGTSKMIKELMQVRLDYEAIGQVFLNNRELFELYPTYCLNRQKSTKMFKMHEHLIETIGRAVGDRYGLGSHLMRPILRLAKYEQLLVKLRKNLMRSDLPHSNIAAAVELIQHVAVESNNVIELDSFKDSMHQSSMVGKFIMRNAFRLLTPKKINVVVFLFQNKIVLTKKDKHQEDNHIFYESIDMDVELSITEELDLQTTFTISRCVRGQKINFRLDAPNAEIKQRWIKVLKKRMWEQLMEAKRKNKLAYEPM